MAENAPEPTVPLSMYEAKVARVAQLEEQLAQRDEIIRTVTVCGHLTALLETYEMTLSNFRPSVRRNLRQVTNVTDDELLPLPININDQTINLSLKTHFVRWSNILRYSTDPKVDIVHNQIMPALGFNDDYLFCKYMALLFCYSSNSIHNCSLTARIFTDENMLIEALENSCGLHDSTVLSAARSLYRISRL